MIRAVGLIWCLCWLCGFCNAQQLLHQSAAISFANSHLTNYKNSELKLAYAQVSPVAEHYTFQHYFSGIEVFGSKVKVNLLKDGRYLSASNNLCSSKLLVPSGNTTAISSTSDKGESLCYFVNDELLVLAIKQRITQCGYDSLKIVDADKQQTLAAWDIAQHYEGDTTIKAKIFLPDPITASAQTYGGTFIDNNDANAAWYDAAQFQVNMPAFFDAASGKFILKNKYAEIIDQVAPTIAPVSSSSDNFFYTRDQSGFEDCNALFHISNFHQYFDSLGFDAILPMAVRVDAHGNFGADNSTFYKTGSTPLLDLGEGGVDDAEDADVIVHEYSHGVSWSANGNFIATNERDALDEGLADYFACSYSKRYNTYRWQNVFSWDGHNEFWDGRTAQTTNTYSTAQNQDIYTLGEVWSSAMMRVWDSIGGINADKLMLQALFSFGDNTDFATAAAYVLQADSIYFAKAHRATICGSFRALGVEPAWGCDTNTAPVNTDLALANSLNFSYGIGNAVLKNIPNNSNISLTDMYGKVVLQQKQISGNLLIPKDLPIASGIYILTIDSGGKRTQYKINKIL
ncbi:MAG: hypothetical protein RL660_308 [Bacteroidota bacterium]|jgi:hypothetical protein